MAGRSATPLGPHLYVVGEEGVPSGPTKIGMTTGHSARSGRPNLQGGNWRRLTVLHREPYPFEDLRWTEWVIHQNLRPRHVLGEWYRVRDLAEPLGWSKFLRRSYRGGVLDGERWTLSRGRHRVLKMTQLLPVKPRRFSVHCACGEVTTSQPNTSMMSALAEFAIDHLGLPSRGPVVTDLRRRFRTTRTADPIEPDSIEA